MKVEITATRIVHYKIEVNLTDHEFNELLGYKEKMVKQIDLHHAIPRNEIAEKFIIEEIKEA